MYWFWYFLFCSQPQFLVLGMFGVLGKEAEEAANDLAAVMGIVLLVVLVLVVIYFCLHGLGVV